jgi:hypothetical protein
MEVSYKLKGGKLHKHRARGHGWTPLSDDAFPAAFISRPSHRTLDAHKYLPVFTAQVATNAQSGKPSLCFNEAHDYEFCTVPEVFAVARMSEDAPPLVMGICPECAKKSDAALYSIMRRQFQSRGIGKADDEGDHAKVVMEIENVASVEAIPGVHIAVALSDKSQSPYDCEIATVLRALLRRGALPRFMAFRRGVHNCHVIVQQLYLDFKEVGIDTSFAYKRGSSPILASRKDPDGLHSWIEADGWAIDVAGAAAGNPIMMQRVADFYERLKVTNVHDIELKEAD